MLKDSNGKPLPFVALNTMGPFDEGSNCGRWIEIDLGDNCHGAGNAQWSPCTGGGAASLKPSDLPSCNVCATFWNMKDCFLCWLALNG
jgi:hypothetical protein